MKANKLKDLALYIHIPFCQKKCYYCDFLSFESDDDTKHKYIQSLLVEIETYESIAKDYLIKSIFIGGGTPSLVNGFYIRDIMNALKKIFVIQGINDSNIQYDTPNKKAESVAEITIEINPGTVSNEKLQVYKNSGINRISFGLQSTKEEELKLLGRIHTYKEFEDNYTLARQIGFNNINVDLISALPGQSHESWNESLDRVIALNPEHISAYSLIVEEGTPFNKLYGEDNIEGHKLLPDEDLDRLIYQTSKERLKEAGYNRYEISNYSKANYESKHNSSYWLGDEYLGIGLGASSYISNTRFSNINDINTYISKVVKYKKSYGKNIITNVKTIASGSPMEDYLGIKESFQFLTLNERMEEFMFLGLRMIKGISCLEFEKSFSQKIDFVYGETIKKLIADGLLIHDGDRIYLTDYGIDLSNTVFVEFLI